jgi:hypothetical protein
MEESAVEEDTAEAAGTDMVEPRLVEVENRTCYFRSVSESD